MCVCVYPYRLHRAYYAKCSYMCLASEYHLHLLLEPLFENYMFKRKLKKSGFGDASHHSPSFSSTLKEHLTLAMFSFTSKHADSLTFEVF